MPRGKSGRTGGGMRIGKPAYTPPGSGPGGMLGGSTPKPPSPPAPSRPTELFAFNPATATDLSAWTGDVVGAELVDGRIQIAPGGVVSVVIDPVPETGLISLRAAVIVDAPPPNAGGLLAMWQDNVAYDFRLQEMRLEDGTWRLELWTPGVGASAQQGGAQTLALGDGTTASTQEIVYDLTGLHPRGRWYVDGVLLTEVTDTDALSADVTLPALLGVNGVGNGTTVLSVSIAAGDQGA